MTRGSHPPPAADDLARRVLARLPVAPRAAAGSLAGALVAGVLAGALASPPTPGATSPRRVVVLAAANAAAPDADAGALDALQAAPPPPVPPVAVSPPPAPPPAGAVGDSSGATSSGSSDAGSSSSPASDAGDDTSSQDEDADPEPARAPVKHVVLIVLADKSFGETFGAASQAPYLARELRAQGVLLRRYHATAHGPLPNLVALLSGQGANPATATGCAALTPFAPAGKPAKDGQLRGAGCVFPASVATLPAQLEARRLAWRAYVEGAEAAPDAAPGPCPPPPTGPDGTPAPGDRNPFLLFAAIAGAADCTANVTGLAQLAADVALAPDQAPALSVVLPGPCLAGREGACPPGEPDGIARADAWLRELVPQLIAAPAYADDTMIVITFDQARATGKLADFASCCGQQRGVNEPASIDPQAPPEGGGRVGALVLSPKVKAGATSDEPYNHFALLRTIERAFRLEPLALAAAADVPSLGEDVFPANP